MHINVQGLRGKFIEVKHTTNKYNVDILILNEIKINLDKQRFNIPGYDKIYERKGQHLGTVMYIKRGLRWAQTPLIDSIDDADRRIEGCSINLYTKYINNDKITIKGIYIPIPRQGDLVDEFETLLLGESAIIIGDSNLRTRQLNHTRDVGLGIVLRDAIQRGSVRLVNTGLPSRPTSPGNGILDTAIVNHDHSLLEFKCQQRECISSDHLPWTLDVIIDSNYEQPMSRNLMQIKGTREGRQAFEELLANNMVSKLQITSNEDCDMYIAEIEKAIVKTLDELAPLRIVDFKERLPTHIRDRIAERNAKKQRAWRLRYTGLRAVARRQYNTCKHQLSKEIIQHKEAEWTKLLENTKDNRKRMWAVQRALKKPPTKLPHFSDCTNELEIIDRMVDTAIVKEATIDASDECTEITTPFAPLNRSSKHELKLALKRFKNSKAPGPDGIKADILKLGGDTMITIFKRIMDYVLEMGYFPKRWKISTCIFLHKAGKDHSDPKSYRPISLLNIMGKWAERIILNRIETELSEIIPSHQHGFTRNRGTATQTLRTGKYIADALDKGHSVAMISTDLSKAFDSINHKGLCRKLIDAGARNNIVKMIESYLSNRTTRGSFRTTLGTEQRVPHGVPQGSILGPAIFNLYVADLPNERIAGQMLSQYADDLCILNAAERPDHATRRAEWAATDIIDYYKKWGLKCNVDKTECIMFSHKRPRLNNMNTGYRNYVQIRGERIAFKPEIKYLGVWLDKRLSMNKHAKENIEKAKRVRGALYPIIGYRSKLSVDIKLLVIQACLLPVIDYGVIQLLPRYSKTNLLKLERQYKMALKSAAHLPRRTDTDLLWEYLQQDPWHIRAHDLHGDMIERLKSLSIEGLQEQGPAYTRYGQHNPFLFATRVGEIEYINKKDRDKPLFKRLAPFRQRRL